MTYYIKQSKLEHIIEYIKVNYPTLNLITFKMAATLNNNIKAQAKDVLAIFQDKFKIEYDSIDLTKLHCPKPSSRTIPGKDSNQTYSGSACEYISGEINGKPTYQEFRFQGPPLYSKFGISQMVDKNNGNVSYSIYSPLPMADEDINFFVTETLTGLHETMCQFTGKYAEDIGKPNLTADGAKSMIPELFKYRKDKVTNKLHKDRDPFLYSKLLSRGMDGRDGTVFVGIGDKKIIPWYKLENVEMKFIPVYSLGFYAGGMGISFPMKMVEAVVLFYRNTNATSSQADTIEKYKDQYMEEYKKSLEAMANMAVGDGLGDNESTLGSLQHTEATVLVSKEVGENDGEESTAPAKAPPTRTRQLR